MIDITTSLTTQNEQDHQQLFLLLKTLYLQGQTGLRFYYDEKFLIHILLSKTYFGDDISQEDLQTQLLRLFTLADIQGQIVKHEALQNCPIQVQTFKNLLESKVDLAIQGLENNAKLSCLDRLSCMRSLHERRIESHQRLWKAVHPSQFIENNAHAPLASYRQQSQKKGPTQIEIQNAEFTHDSNKHYAETALQNELWIQQEKFYFETLMQIENYKMDNTISLAIATDLPSCSTVIKEDENTHSVCLTFHIRKDRYDIIRRDCFNNIPHMGHLGTHFSPFSIQDKLVSEFLQHDAELLRSIINQAPNLKCNLKTEFSYHGTIGFSITLLMLSINPESRPTFINHMQQIFISAGLLEDYSFSNIEIVECITAEQKHQQKIDSLISCTNRFFSPNPCPSKWIQYPNNHLKGSYIGHDVRYLNLTQQKDEKNPIQLVKSLCDMGFHAVERSTTSHQSPLVVVDLTQSIPKMLIPK